jgi:predicted ATPase/DNA-binding SARP family transcriptional activator
MVSAPVAPSQARLLLWGWPELHAHGSVLPLAPERRFQLLAVLAAHEGRWVDRDRAAALLWPGSDLAAARRNLRKVLHEARGVPGTHALEASDHALRWPVDTDMQAFRRAVAALPGQPWARDLLQGPERRDWRARIDGGGLDQTLALRRGDLLQGLAEPADSALLEWIALERERADRAWHAVACACLRVGSAAQACARIAQRMLDFDALDETAVSALVAAQLALGRRADAEALYQRYAQRLLAELGVEPSSSVRALLHARVPVQAPTPRTAPPGERQVPVGGVSVAASAPAPFVGRRTELAELCALLARPECRLLTLLGPGGAGKSRLARHALVAGAPLGALFEGGSLWVELQDVPDTASVPARLAQSLGLVGESSGDPLQRLGAAVPGARTLWVLDNAEHLAGLGELLGRLLTGVSSLTVLVTSRCRLHGAGEWVLPLAGLALPDDESRDLEAAASFDAVRLFESRARQAQPDFRLEAHLGAVIDIVDAVAGLPLAVELAASWVRLLPPQRIAADLRRSIDLLERDPANPTPLARPDHASLRLVLERSWGLLGEREREAMAALAVFSGGFTHDAARAVARCPLPLLSALVDKSVVAVVEGGRFGLHPAVAAFAGETLEQDEARAEVLRLRHAEHYSRVLAGLAPHAIGDPRPLLAGVEAEFANLCAAWRCAVRAGRVDWVAAMVRALWAYFENRGRQREGIALLAPALALPADSPAARHAQARLRHGLSMLHHRAGLADEALQLARSGTALAAGGPDTEAWIGCLLNTGTCLWVAGDVTGATTCFEAGLAIARERADPQCEAWALGNLGVALSLAGQPEQAQRCLEQALAGSRAVGDQYGVGVHLVNLGALARDRTDLPDPDSARRWLEQASRHAQAMGMEVIALYAALSLGHSARVAGDWKRAQSHYGHALAMGRRHGQLLLAEAAELGLARLALAQGDAGQALLGAQALARASSQRACDDDLPRVLLLYADCLAALGDARGAARVLHCILALNTLHAPTRQAALASLSALPAALSAEAGVPTLAEVTASLVQA